MSLDASIWAWKQRPLRPSFKLLLLALADRAGHDDTTWPSKAALAYDTGLDRKTIIEGLQILQQLGFIERTDERKGRTNQIPVYRLIGVIHREQSQKRNGSENGTVKGSRFSHERVPKTDKKGSQKRDTEPIREPIRELSKPKFKIPENQRSKMLALVGLKEKPDEP